jgi:predicted secreted protein
MIKTRHPRLRATAATLAATFLLSIAGVARVSAQPTPPITLSPFAPMVTLSASATASVSNDRMLAMMRTESDNADPAAAANTVNTRMARAIARAKGTKGVDASTSGYSSFQITEKNQPARWRVTQTLKLESSDFTALSGLVSQLQAEGGLVVDGIQFSVSESARRQAEEGLTQQAIKSWQARATDAARGFGFDSWRVGRVTIQAGDSFRPQPVMRTMAFSEKSAPISAEAGNTDVTVTVSGEALLDTTRPPAR